MQTHVYTERKGNVRKQPLQPSYPETTIQTTKISTTLKNSFPGTEINEETLSKSEETCAFLPVKQNAF